MNIDLMDRFFGDTEGHKINVVIDTEGAAILSKLGLPSTKAGAIAFLENTLDAGINAIPEFTEAEKTAAETIINGLLANAGGPPVPAPAAAARPALAPAADTPILDEPVFRGIGG